MIILNLQNIEELIFLDNNMQIILPDLRHIFDQWLLSKRVPTLRSLRLRSLMDLLNNLKPIHIQKLEEYFQDSLLLDKIDYHLIKNITLSFDSNIEKELSNFNDFGNFIINRDAEKLHVLFWR